LNDHFVLDPEISGRNYDFWAMRKEHVVLEEEDGRHLRSLLEDILLNVPAKGIRRGIQRGQIVVNKTRVPSNHQVRSGDQISIHIQTTSSRSIDVKIPVIEEDDHFAIINKPAGIVVGGGRKASVSDILPHILVPSKADDALSVPRSVHRLDKSTSGLLLIAKTKSALADLSQQFEARSVQKIYTALIKGLIETEGKIDIPLSGKNAVTSYTPIENMSRPAGDYTIVKLAPMTGRTHQLRKHMAFIGHPIIGDRKYAKNIQHHGYGLMLCATQLVFRHPLSEDQVQCDIDVPASFKKQLEDL
jgi:23S rRNA pseudouridine1911/1915/1917 synthase